MNLQKHVIIINGVDKTYQVESIRFDGYKYAVKFQNADTVYSYNGDKVIWLTNPLPVEFKGCHVFVNGKKEKNIKVISLFADNGTKYYAITYGKDFTKHYTEGEVDIRSSCLFEKNTNILDYLRQCAGINSRSSGHRQTPNDSQYHRQPVNGKEINADDGFSFHNEKTEQFQCDRLKDHSLKIYELPLLRLSTIGHSEEQRIV